MSLTLNTCNNVYRPYLPHIAVGRINVNVFACVMNVTSYLAGEIYMI